VDITVSDPGVFASLTLSGGGQSVTVSPASATTHFVLAPIGLAAGASLTFSLNGVIAAHPVILETGIKYAGITIGVASGWTDGAQWPLSAGLLLIGLALTAMPAPRRRRIVFGAFLVIVLAATQLGCGGGSNGATIFASSQTATAVTATFTSGGAVEVNGLPAQLGVIRAL
jgi:hypothetical protein